MRRNSSNGSVTSCRTMRLPMCATPCSAAATATGPRPTSRCRASSMSSCRRMARARSIRAEGEGRGARAVYPRGEGDARSDLDGQFQKWFPAAAQVATKEFGIDWNFTRTAEDDPLYAIEPVAVTAVNTIVAQGGAVAMKMLVNDELQNKSGANPSERSTRHIEVQLPSNITYRVGDHLSVVPRNDPTLVDSVARRAQGPRVGRCGAPPLRLPAGRPDQASGRRRPPRAIAGWRCRLGGPSA